MRKLVAAALVLTLLVGCASPTAILTGGDSRDIVASGKIDQAMLEEAWKEALAIGKGNPSWPLPMSLARVVYVPSTLVMGGFVFYGRTVTEPMLINGRLELVETIEIHLSHNMACHIRQVLVHELLHTVVTRRAFTDKTLEAELDAAGGQEAWVRQVYPGADMGPCSDK